MLKRGFFRTEKVEYPDGVGCCLWRVFEGEEDSGYCFDFVEEDLEDIISILTELRNLPAEEYE